MSRVVVYHVIVKSGKGMDHGADSVAEYGITKAVARHLKFGQRTFCTRDNEFRIAVKKRHFTSDADLKQAMEIFHDVSDLIDDEQLHHCDSWVVYPADLKKYDDEPEVEPEPQPRSDEDEEEGEEEQPTEDDDAFVVGSKRKRTNQDESESEWEDGDTDSSEEEEEGEGV